MPALSLHPRVAENTADASVYLGKDACAAARDLKCATRARGGYWQASYWLSQEDFTLAELTEFYMLNIASRLRLAAYGITAWEGLLWKMELSHAGTVSTVDLDRMINACNIYYSNTVGSRKKTGWSTNSNSTGIFGERGVAVSLGGSSKQAAANLRATILANQAWPRSWRTGGDNLAGVAVWARDPARLSVTARGYFHTLDWEWQETTVSNRYTDLALATLIGNSEFVTAGMMDTNDNGAGEVARVDCYPIPRPLGECVLELLEQGDTSGDAWQGGVYAGRTFNYHAAPTDWTYQRQGAALLDKCGGQVECLALVRPGFLLYNADAPTGWAKPGTASDWDDPQVGYVEEVEWVAGSAKGPDELRLMFPGEVTPVTVIQERIRRGNA